MRTLSPILALLLLGCDDTQITFEPGTPAADGYAEGREEGYRQGFEKGHAKGHQQGKTQGYTEGRADAMIRWTPVGLGLGILFGLGGVLYLRREEVATARALKKQRDTLEAALGRLPARLSIAERKLLGTILQRQHDLERALDDATGPDSADLRIGLRPQLQRLGGAVAKLTQLLVALRTATEETTATHTLEARLAGRRAERTIADHSLHSELDAVIAADARTLAARQRAEDSQARCTLKLEALASFLDHARMSIANVEAAGTITLDTELGQTLDTLEEIVRGAHTELL